MSDLAKTELKKAIDNLNEDLDKIGLENLTKQDIETLSKSIIFDTLKTELSNRAKVTKIDIEKLKEDFIHSPSLTGQPRPESTQRVYKNALNEFYSYCDTKVINPLLINRIEAETYFSLSKGSIKTRNSKLSYLKSYYEYLVSYDFIEKNPMRNIKRLKPSAAEMKTNIENKRRRIPTEEDIRELLKTFKKQPCYFNSVLVMAYRGFRISALEEIKIHDGIYTAISKGKFIEGNMSESLIDLSRISKFYPNKNTFLTLFNRRVKRLIQEGKISHKFSVHDLRHYYAINHYLKYKDIYRTSRALNHASISVTQYYLRGLKLNI